MNHSETLTKISAAMVAMQGKLKTLSKDADNPYFHSKYTPLDAIWEEIRPILSESGLSVIQFPSQTGLETIILHESGEWISCDSKWDIDASNPQKIGSAITYMRRYGLSAALGIVSGDDDDDGNVATVKKETAKEQPSKETKSQVDLVYSEIGAIVKAKKVSATGENIVGWLMAQTDDCKYVDVTDKNQVKACIFKYRDMLKEKLLCHDKNQIEEMLLTGLPF